MAKRNYDETSVVRALIRKSGVTVRHDKLIEVNKDAVDVGNKTWGKIDYLCKVHGYSYIIVGNTGNVSKVKTNDKGDITNKKVVKREAKLNMANMTKNAMKNARGRIAYHA